MIRNVGVRNSWFEFVGQQVYVGDHTLMSIWVRRGLNELLGELVRVVVCVCIVQLVYVSM